MPTRQDAANLGSPRKMGRAATTYEHADRVTWRTILDRVEAPMAPVEPELARPEEIVLPYVVDPAGRTSFAAIERRHFELGPGESTDDAAEAGR